MSDGAVLARRHLWIGWCSILLFATLGLGLEALHGFKAGFYLDVSQETRRLMWTLAHTHGTLFGVIHVLLAASLRGWTSFAAALPTWSSHALIAAGVLMPLGFFLGGAWFYGGDPGLGVLLSPVGGALFLASLVGIARSSLRASD